MIIPTNLLYQAYPTLIPNWKNYLKASNYTCDLLNPDRDAPCNVCPLYSGNPVSGRSCALDHDDNPDVDESWALFYEAYPELLI